MTLRLVPVTLRDARRFIAEHHSHNAPPTGWLFGVGVEEVGGGLVAVGIAGRMKARALDKLDNVEIIRVATDCTPMSCSMVYGHLCSAAKHLGRRRVYTYTLARERASCVKAVGFVIDAELPDERGWNRPCRPRIEYDLFGAQRTPMEPKVRWVRELLP